MPDAVPMKTAWVDVYAVAVQHFKRIARPGARMT
jgi:hypothetical protein